MKRFLVFVLVVLLVLSGVFGILHAQVRNIYDEMYYSYSSALPWMYTSASFDRFGLKNISNDMRSLGDGVLVEYLANHLLQPAEMLMIQWFTRENKIQYSYITPSDDPDICYVLDVSYSVKDKTLIYEPLRLTFGSPADSITDEQERKAVSDYLVQEYNKRIPERWLTVNGRRSRFTESSPGQVSITDRIWDR